MANDFDEFPVYDPLVKNDGVHMSDVWTSFISTFYMSLIGYLTQYGILLPVVTTAQMASIQSPQEGQLIYNVDATPGTPRTAQLKVWQVKSDVGAWRTITTT